MGRGDDVCFLEADGGTAALVSAVLIVDDATSAPPPAPNPLTPVANDVPTPFPTLAPGTDLLLPHRDARGVIQTTGGEAATVALTFDDGPSPTYTPQVLRILDKHDIKATFSVVGETRRLTLTWCERSLTEATLCDHTVTHDLGLPTRDGERIHTEIGGRAGSHARRSRNRGAVLPGTGWKFRDQRHRCRGRLRLEPLGWSVDPRDWTEPGADAIQTTVVEGVARVRSCCSTTAVGTRRARSPPWTASSPP